MLFGGIGSCVAGGCVAWPYYSAPAVLYASSVGVQNADDNSYTPAAGLPVLELITSSSAVSCLNNEVGFTRDDVDGICEVGGSKKQGKAGFTGE